MQAGKRWRGGGGGRCPPACMHAYRMAAFAVAHVAPVGPARSAGGGGVVRHQLQVWALVQALGGSQGCAAACASMRCCGVVPAARLAPLRSQVGASAGLHRPHLHVARFLSCAAHVQQGNSPVLLLSCALAALPARGVTMLCTPKASAANSMSPLRRCGPGWVHSASSLRLVARRPPGCAVCLPAAWRSSSHPPCAHACAVTRLQ